MSFKDKLTAKRKRKSDKRRSKRKLAKKLREERIKKKNPIIQKVKPLPKVPKLPEEIIVEEIVKNGAMEGVINVNFAGHIYTITVIEVKETFSKKVICFINMGKQKCVILEGFDKVIRLNRESRASTLARAV